MNKKLGMTLLAALAVTGAGLIATVEAQQNQLANNPRSKNFYG